MRLKSNSDGIIADLQEPLEQAEIAPLGLPAWTWSVFALLLGLSITAWGVGRQYAHADQARILQQHKIAEEARVALLGSLESCEMLLRSVQTAFLIQSDGISAGEFSTIYRNQHARTEFPSLQALAFAGRTVAPDGEHFITELYQPLEGNTQLVGLDVLSQPANYAALRSSRDSDQVVMSAPFQLVQHPVGSDSRDGITLRLAIYGRGPPPATVVERRARIRGSLAASFQVKRLIADAVPAKVIDQLRIVVRDSAQLDGPPLYDSRPDLEASLATTPRIERDLRFGGRTWRLDMQPLPSSGPALAWQDSLLWLGVASSVLLALLVWSVATTRRRAIQAGRRMSLRFRDSEQRFRTLNDLLPALVLMARSGDGRILYANQAACARLGAGVEDGIALETLFYDKEVRDRLEHYAPDVEWSNVEAQLVSVNGDRFWAATSIARVAFGGDERLLMVASDVSEQRQLTELLSFQASHDPLTELYNRREFERNVQRSLYQIAKDGPVCAMLYIDLDQFKLINDTSGHLAGDQLLSQLAMAMAELLRGGDILARLGGDEFGILARDTDAEGALVLAERLRSRIESYIYVWEARSYTISASIGVVMIDRSGLTLAEVLSHADSACYMAKDHGRNRIHLFSEQDDETVRRRGEMEWANRLRWVIEENRLLLDYQEVQPLQSPSSPDTGPHIELLVRLRDEDGRVVMPGAFLPAAERYGMVAQVDRWVVAEAISHFDQLHASGVAPGRCSLNLSAATLEDNDLADFVLALIEKHHVAPSRLCFEITETVAVRDLARAVRFIDRLRSVGCQVALDDFGAGMSSFGYLKNLPVDVIKIDGSFIRDLETDPMSRTIVEAITSIGHQRGLEVVAEWVSSDSLVATVRSLGVDYGQGFALHRPEPVLYQAAERDQHD